MSKMDNLELKAIIRSHIDAAAGFIGGDLSDERSASMDYYLGEPFGNEVDGRSSVVSKDVADRVEWLMPQLMRTFTATENPVTFDPVGPEDEEGAEQETDYCNHVYWKDNPGWTNTYSWLKDGLLQKTGYIKIMWEDDEKVTREEYSNLTDDELMLVTTRHDAEVEIAEHEMNGINHDVVLKVTENIGKAAIVPVPPEEFGIIRDHNNIDLDGCPFCFHKTEKTISDLTEAGYDRKKLESIPSDDDVESEEELSRNHLSDEQDIGDDEKDHSMRKIRLYECYVKIDYDGDGIAELRKITYAGNEILDNEEIDDIPFVAWTPVILTHKHFGLSYADLIMDLQLIKSTVWRQTLDNMYQINNTREAYWDGKVNQEDMLKTAPGAKVRTKVPPAEAIMGISTPDVTGVGYQMLDYSDRVLEGRTGVGPNTMGLNDSLLSNNKGDASVQRVMSAAEQRIELIARIFAEVGLKKAFLKLHAILQKHQNKERVVRIRNKWVPVDPREWKDRTNMTVSVGLGNGEKAQQLAAMDRILSMQERIIQGGGFGVLVGNDEIYNAVTDFSRHAGIKGPVKYFRDPNSPEAIQFQQQQAQNQQPDPNIIAIQTQAKIEQEKRQVDLQKMMLDHEKAAAQAEIDQAKLVIEREKNELKGAIDSMRQEIEVARLKAERAEKIDDAFLQEHAEAMKAMVQQQEACMDAKLEASQQQLDRYKAELDSATKLQLEQMKIAAQGIQADQMDQREIMSALNSIIKDLSGNMKTPKVIERDELGRPIKIGGRAIKRNESGQIEGLE